MTGDGLRLSELIFSLALAANACRILDGNVSHSCMERLIQKPHTYAAKITP